jgi:hypothetical protein
MFNINKLIIVLLLFGFNSHINAQEKLPRKLKKLGLTVENVVYTNEKITGYPKGLIYEVNKPDSVYYFGCLGSDAVALTDYFDKQEMGFTMSVNDTIRRVIGDYEDKILLKPILELKNQFYNTSNGFNLAPDQTYYVLVYYWCKDVFISDMKNNLKIFKKFVDEHPEKHINFLAVCTDKPKNTK